MKKSLFAAILLSLMILSSGCGKSGGMVGFDDAPEYNATSAVAYYYGGSDSGDMYGLSFFQGAVTEDYTLGGRGMELYLELVTSPTGDGFALTPGTYNALLKVSGDNVSGTFATGSMVDGILYGSYLALRRSEVSEIDYSVVTDGVLTVSKRGGNYILEAKVIAAGEPLVFNYSGPITFVDNSADNNIPKDTNYEFSSFTQGELVYYGASEGLTYWAIYLGDEDADLLSLTGGHILTAELCTSATSKDDIKAGTYTVSDTRADMTALPLYGSENDGYSGTMYIESSLIVVGSSSGTVTISKTGDNYTVVADLTDAEFNNTFKGSFTGPLTYSDESTPSAGRKVRTTEKTLSLGGRRPVRRSN